jgi:hypothetical protein
LPAEWVLCLFDLASIRSKDLLFMLILDNQQACDLFEKYGIFENPFEYALAIAEYEEDAS